MVGRAYQTIGETWSIDKVATGFIRKEAIQKLVDARNFIPVFAQ